jgi:hypothetical protein
VTADASRATAIRKLLVIAALMAVAAVGYVLTTGGAHGPGPEGIAVEHGTLLGPSTTGPAGRTVDGIACEATEQVVAHTHAHLAVYVDGVLRPLPLGIGIVTPVVRRVPGGEFASATSCYYWLHVHAQDGVIHVESPTRNAVFTLGDFFDVWGQPLSPTRVATASGPVTAYVDGRRWTGDPRTIPLLAHTTVQLDVGFSASAPVTVDWSHASL